METADSSHTDYNAVVAFLASWHAVLAGHGAATRALTRVVKFDAVTPDLRRLMLLAVECRGPDGLPMWVLARQTDLTKSRVMAAQLGFAGRGLVIVRPAYDLSDVDVVPTDAGAAGRRPAPRLKGAVMATRMMEAEPLAEIAQRSAEVKALAPEMLKDLLRTFRHADKPRAQLTLAENCDQRLGSSAQEAVGLARLMYDPRYRYDLAAAFSVSAFQNHEFAMARKITQRHWERLGDMLGMSR
ncbi:hypothetical protein [Methylobacterium frigidaeris]|uniref:Uncharacterized protein n=1 Tax=Methylobacterium frigidaeris TaxID=2038277 RepID=A0AA37M8T8_9HYPH|nr:hypothetical protein [Methylobacterium frigidaeris]GJD66461.1 hypothetical protein MPEAHAMD_6659 [Methylobacterium frigidaeris]